MFTFIVIIYNEEEVITDLLNSIKYQIEKYGKDIDFQLILADDGSKDRSCQAIENWLISNENLFKKVNRQYCKKNRGTCKSLADAMRKIEGDNFYLVAGDDMIAKGNMFAKYKLLEKYDIVANGVLKFKNNHIITDKKDYLNVVLQGLYSEHFLSKAVKFGCPILNGAIIRKELLTEGVLDIMEKYILLEDRPRYYQIFKERKKIKYYFEMEPILLYRESNTSVSNFNSKLKNILDADIKKFLFRIRQESSSNLEKIELWIQEKLVIYRGKRGVMWLVRYITPYYLKLLSLSLLNINKIRNMEKKLIDQYAKENDMHMENIRQWKTK